MSQVRPLQSLVLLCSAIHAELNDCESRVNHWATQAALRRVRELVREIERHGEKRETVK